MKLTKLMKKVRPKQPVCVYSKENHEYFFDIAMSFNFDNTSFQNLIVKEIDATDQVLYVKCKIKNKLNNIT